MYKKYAQVLNVGVEKIYCSREMPIDLSKVNLGMLEMLLNHLNFSKVFWMGN